MVSKHFQLFYLQGLYSLFSNRPDLDRQAFVADRDLGPAKNDADPTGS
jgi:hypothetical protein